MKPYQDVFKRYEKKYLLDDQKYQKLLSLLTGFMLPDSYGLHTISNIYYDTDNYQLIRTSLEKPVYKEKFRVRTYGIAKADSTAFLELKKKFKGVVYKRRISVPLSEAMRVANTGVSPNDGSQILNEIDWFMRSYHPQPKVVLCYERLALYGKEDSTLRATFDSNIRWRDTDLDLTHGDYGTPLIPGMRILEVKLPGSMPLWMAHLFNELGIYPESFSKYGTCYRQNLICKTGVIDCA